MEHRFVTETWTSFWSPVTFGKDPRLESVLAGEMQVVANFDLIQVRRYVNN